MICRTTIYIVITKSGKGVGVPLAVHKDLVSIPKMHLEQDSFVEILFCEIQQRMGVLFGVVYRSPSAF